MSSFCCTQLWFSRFQRRNSSSIAEDVLLESLEIPLETNRLVFAADSFHSIRFCKERANQDTSLPLICITTLLASSDFKLITSWFPLCWKLQPSCLPIDGQVCFVVNISGTFCREYICCSTLLGCWGSPHVERASLLWSFHLGPSSFVTGYYSRFLLLRPATFWNWVSARALSSIELPTWIQIHCHFCRRSDTVQLKQTGWRSCLSS